MVEITESTTCRSQYDIPEHTLLIHVGGIAVTCFLAEEMCSGYAIGDFVKSSRNALWFRSQFGMSFAEHVSESI